MAIVWPPAWAPNGCAMWQVGHPTSLSPCLNGPPATSPPERSYSPTPPMTSATGLWCVP